MFLGHEHVDAAACEQPGPEQTDGACPDNKNRNYTLGHRPALPVRY